MLKKFLLVAALGLILLPLTVRAVTDDCASKTIEERINCYEDKLNENKGQQQTLSSTISYLDSKIT